jgi:hypothetical protein
VVDGMYKMTVKQEREWMGWLYGAVDEVLLTHSVCQPLCVERGVKGPRPIARSLCELSVNGCPSSLLLVEVAVPGELLNFFRRCQGSKNLVARDTDKYYCECEYGTGRPT